MEKNIIGDDKMKSVKVNRYLIKRDGKIIAIVASAGVKNAGKRIQKKYNSTNPKHKWKITPTTLKRQEELIKKRGMYNKKTAVRTNNKGTKETGAIMTARIKIKK